MQLTTLTYNSDFLPPCFEGFVSEPLVGFLTQWNLLRPIRQFGDKGQQFVDSLCVCVCVCACVCVCGYMIVICPPGVAEYM